MRRRLLRILSLGVGGAVFVPGLRVVAQSVARVPVAPTLPAIDQGAGRGPINYGYVVDSARDSLEHAWTDSADQVERAYCVLAGDVSMSHDPASWSNAWYIHRVVPAIGVEGATPYLIHYDCPVGTVGSLHIHTPTTCTNVGASAMTPRWQCQRGGRDAYFCSVDETDQRESRRDSIEFSIVQCSRHAFVWYWPGRRQ